MNNDALTTLALLTLCVVAASWDLATHRIPNVLTVSGLLVALMLRAIQGPSPLAAGFAAAFLALLLSVPLVLAGGLGGGDAKLLAASAAFVGLAALPMMLLVTAIVGGGLGLAVAARRRALGDTFAHCRVLLAWIVPVGPGAARPPRTLRTPGALAVPYGVAIAAGALAAEWWA